MKRKTYLKTFSATLLCLINTVFALLSFILLFRTVFYLGTYIGTSIRAYQFQNYSMIQKELADTLASVGILSPLEKWTVTASLPLTFRLTETIVSSVFVVILSVVSPLLLIFNGIGSFNLRFRNKGCRMIKVVHILYAILTILSMVFVVYAYVRIFIDKNLRKAFTVIDSMNVWIAIALFIVIGIILLIVQIIMFCYHKDIVQQMNYINSDLQEQEDVLEDNHLSGIACLWGVLLLVPVIFLASLLTNQTPLKTWIALSILVLLSIKYFCVAACNRSLKKAVFAKARRNRRMS